MLEPGNNNELPALSGKRYFTSGEVSGLCGLKPHVLRCREPEFPQLKHVERQGYRHYRGEHLLAIRQIRSLFYEEAFTIVGARKCLEGDHAGTGQ